MNLRNMKRGLILILVMLGMTTIVVAQPAKRRTTTTTSTATRQGTTTTLQPTVDRAALSFPTAEGMPEDVSWRRDIYRQLDLLGNDKNAALYYPITPVDKQVNLFTYLFRLILTGRINVYNYQMDTNISYAEKDKLNIKQFLDNNHIYYEEKNGKYTVQDVDIPSEFVTRYYIKESVYLDQRTNTTRTKVTDICPILVAKEEYEFDTRTDDERESDAATGNGVAAGKPLFWVKYDDIASYLAKLPVMTSNLNNVTNMTADDYFTLNRYDGKIYKTNNMQGTILVKEHKDSALVAEQNRIEQQLADFDKHLWGQNKTSVSQQQGNVTVHTAQVEIADSSAVEVETDVEKKSSSRRSSATAKKPTTARRTEKPASTTKTKKEKTPAAAKPARVSVRRERR